MTDNVIWPGMIAAYMLFISGPSQAQTADDAAACRETIGGREQYYPIDLARRSCTKFAEADVSDSALLAAIARFHYANGEYSRAYGQFRKAAAGGNWYADLMIARMNLYQQATRLDPALTFYHAQRSALSGRASAQSVLAFLYGRGIGVTKDLNRSFELYDSAIGKGDSGAFIDKALLLLELDPPRPWEAARMIEQALNNGVPNAKRHLGWIHFKFEGKGTAPDGTRELAAKWYIEAANDGDAEAALMAGQMYRHAYGVAQNLAEARRLLSIAVAAKVAHADTELAKLDVHENNLREAAEKERLMAAKNAADIAAERAAKQRQQGQSTERKEVTYGSLLEALAPLASMMPKTESNSYANFCNNGRTDYQLNIIYRQSVDILTNYWRTAGPYNLKSGSCFEFFRSDELLQAHVSVTKRGLLGGISDVSFNEGEVRVRTRNGRAQTHDVKFCFHKTSMPYRVVPKDELRTCPPGDDSYEMRLFGLWVVKDTRDSIDVVLP